LATWFAHSYALSVAVGQYAYRARQPWHLLAEITAVLGIGPDRTAIRSGRLAVCRRYHTSREKARTARAPFDEWDMSLCLRALAHRANAA
jgi:hypothetical protein